MDALTARSIAHAAHGGQRDRRGTLCTEHIERVAASVSSEARSVAFLHDLLERTDTPYEALRVNGLTDVEASALELLTRTDGEPYATHVLRIAHTRGPAGRLARAVKVADLEDHLLRATHDSQPGDPPYAWARRHIAIAQERRGERRSDQVAYFAPEPRASVDGLLPSKA
jgi:hypothetical protein